MTEYDSDGLDARQQEDARWEFFHVGVIPVEYRAAARWYYEVPRPPMAHRFPMAHRVERPAKQEAFLLAFAVLVIGLVALWLLLTVAVSGWPR